MKFVLLLKCETRPTEAAVGLYQGPKCVWFCSFSTACAYSLYRKLSLPGELKRDKVFTWQKVVLPPGVTLPCKASNPAPRSPFPQRQLCDFSCKRVSAIYKEMCLKSSRPGSLEG